MYTIYSSLNVWSNREIRPCFALLIWLSWVKQMIQPARPYWCWKLMRATGPLVFRFLSETWQRRCYVLEMLSSQLSKGLKMLCAWRILEYNGCMLEVQNVAAEFRSGGQWWRFTSPEGIIGKDWNLHRHIEIGLLEPLPFGWKPEARPSDDKWAECTSNRLKPVSCAETSNRIEQDLRDWKGRDGWLTNLESG